LHTSPDRLHRMFFMPDQYTQRARIPEALESNLGTTSYIPTSFLVLLSSFRIKLRRSTYSHNPKNQSLISKPKSLPLQSNPLRGLQKGFFPRSLFTKTLLCIHFKFSPAHRNILSLPSAPQTVFMAQLLINYAQKQLLRLFILAILRESDIS
jgi:hypothetical protein